jgi:hypothetical protein
MYEGEGQWSLGLIFLKTNTASVNFRKVVYVEKEYILNITMICITVSIQNCDFESSLLHNHDSESWLYNKIMI